MFSKFDEDAQKILIMAKKEMRELRHPYVGTEHLLLAILNNRDLEVTKDLEEYEITYERFRDELIKIVGIGKKANDWYLFTPLLKRIIENAMLIKKDNNSMVSPLDLFIALLDEGEGVANRILMGMNIDIDYLYDKFLKKFNNNITNNGKGLFLEEFAINLNKVCMSDEEDMVVGRDKEINRIMEILLRKTKNNPLLIGDAGVGKTAIVEELSRKIELKCVPNKLLNKKIYSISMASLIAGTKYRGEFEDRINKLIGEIEDRDDVILFIDEVHTLVGAGGAEGAIDASNLFKPYLARGKLKVIGATTQKEYSKYIEKDKALDRRFQKIFINEATVDETKDILKQLKPIYQNYHNVLISDEIIEKIVYYTNKYMGWGKQPDKAIDVLDEVCSKTALKKSKNEEKIRNLNSKINNIKLNKNKAIINHNYKLAITLKDEECSLENEFNKLMFNSKKNKKKKVSLTLLNEVIYDKTKIPINRINNYNYQKISRELNNKIMGQDEAIKIIIENLENNFLLSKNKPLSMLLVGKSGVGKTFLVKEIAKLLYNEEAFIRIDMSEYKEGHSISKIIGAPPGYVGYDNDNCILNKIKEKPYSILLLDEIEKANKNVLKLFLQVLDEGFMTSSSGEKVSFSNVCIFMTSNLGMNKNNLGFTKNDKKLNEELKNFLGVELLNRIGEVVVFRELNNEIIKKIVTAKLTDVVDKEKLDNILSTKIVDKIIEECDYRQFGARRVELLISKYLKNEMLVNNK